MTAVLIDERPPTSHQAHQAHAPSCTMEVLVVEDNAINQMLAQEFLDLLGLNSRIAKNGQEAVQACLERAPNIVLMDIQMPVMDGLECTRQLRALQNDALLPHFPILALSANTMAEDRLASQSAGMDDHLAKPLDYAALYSRLKHWLKP